MNLLYKNDKLYMYVTSKERLEYIPLIYGAKLDSIKGTWYTSVSALLPILTIFPIVKPMDNATAKLIIMANNILVKVNKQKQLVKDKEQLVSEDYPFLMTHQVACNNIAKLRPRYAYFLDTGTR